MTEPRANALVERAIAHVCKVEGGFADYWGRLPAKDETRPLAEGALSRLTFTGNQPVPPTLRQWLAWDATLLEGRWFGDFDASRQTISTMPLMALVHQEFGKTWGLLYREMIGESLPGNAVLLPGGSDSRRMLYLGEADELGEYPILALDCDDMPYLGLMYPGFDVYLADLVGLFPKPKHASYTWLAQQDAFRGRTQQQARLNLYGRVDWEYPEKLG